jgi:hypothetical protein
LTDFAQRGRSFFVPRFASRAVSEKSAGMAEDRREQLRGWIHNVASRKVPDAHKGEIEKTFEEGKSLFDHRHPGG